MTSAQRRPLALIILDGWGYSPADQYNAITAANTPVWDMLWENYPHLFINGSGEEVGLPKGQMGNSEVGHLHIGAGRLVLQDLVRIDQDIENGHFFHNPVLQHALQQAKEKNAGVHILGLLSPGGVHSHDTHIKAMVKMCAQQQIQKCYVHAILDGRDTPPKSALSSIEALEQIMQNNRCGKIASLIGRYYAMDRDQRWDRTEKAYNLYTLGESVFVANSAQAGLELAYARHENDEFVQATSIHEEQQPPIIINDDDAIIFMNFRADRARQLSRAFLNKDFTGFPRQRIPKLSSFVSLTQYALDLPAQVAYPPIELTNLLGEYLATKGLKQLRIAETEKYAHVTFFFNGGIETPAEGEDRILIPSPKVTTYDLKPEMSAYELTDQLTTAIKSQQYDVIICNFANPDMVGHTGNMPATIKAIEVIDACLDKIVQSLNEVGGEAIITSDHGNAELMYDPQTKQPHTAHTTNLVPLLYVGRPATITANSGNLADIAPTMLHLLGLAQPKEMTGRSLLKV